MELIEAVALVAADQRESWPDTTPDEAVAYARSVLVFPDSPPVVGAVALDGDPGQPLFDAYFAVLSATDAELDAVLSR